MDPESYTTSLFKWDYRTGLVQPSNRTTEPVVAQQPTSGNPAMPTTTTTTSAYCILRPREMDGLDEFLQPYGIRYYTAAKIAELGFTVNTLLGMKDEELDDMMNSLCQIFHWDLLVGERYGIKAAVRSERRRLDDDEIHSRYLISASDTPTTTLDAFSQEGLSEEPVQQQKEIVGIVGGATWDDKRKKQQKKSKLSHKKLVVDHRETVEGDHENDNEDNVVMNYHDDAYGELNERQREHPFIVTEPGEVARGKKNGLDYLFHLYDQCRAFLIQVQNIAKERGEKCPTKVTNQVFRYAKKAGACYINKPKMRHYVHCYALHCLDEEGSNVLRRAFKERGENVGSWRQACYKPLVALAARQGWDIDAIFNTHPLLSIWYVPTKLRQLCHAERSRATASSSVTAAAAAAHLLPF